MPDFEIRSATESDLVFALEIYNDVIRTSTATFEERPRELAEFVAAYREKSSARMPWFIAEVAGEIVGYGTYGAFRRASGYAPTVEHSVHVRADFRARGVGSALLLELIAEARRTSIHSMIAVVDASNEVSIALHVKLGFVKVGEIPQAARKFSRWLDALFMQLIVT